ncbi:DUF1499 domain-containing protein [Methylocystis sp. MJC1]|uniref:DUF1499 domain-containing protein n=1 Tax=Methylocystis sp. MJC1 TaxID=2654282 RepID=UPI0013ED0D3F|nr:DUF1499 domain-containing protein [Methylocystis sp. MJC1]KAF2992082.1 hypothetical protein MJC1_00454 [Methylocystis sp. MJC1]MBU6527225.1 DUF1499 domain-containing protein [Methylocystis sp. MJC1]UZX13652.1 DUF1499 domain-containing protein [Methylocystis sp. MJC1]
MRRTLPPEPWSQAALWSRDVALFGATVALLSVLLARLNVIEPSSALAAFGAAVALALVALLLVGAASVVIWRTGRRGVGSAVGGGLIALLTLAYPSYLAVEAVRLPVLSDISTDVGNPPYFSLSRAAYDARKGFQPKGLPPKAREAQRPAYPDVEPIVVDLDADEAFALVLKTAKAVGWKVVDQRPPGGRTGEGHADFLDKTPIMGFDEDITIRLKPLPGQTRIDLRSASRYGRHDFGANAARIVAFAEELQTQLDAR